MSDNSIPGTTALHPLHRLWRLLPPEPRRRFLARATALVAPKPDRNAPGERESIGVVGEVTRASGLGEGARLIHHALRSIGVPGCLIEAGVGVPGESADLDVADPAVPGGGVAPGAALVMVVNAPGMPLAAIQLGRRTMRGRYIVGYWNWELPVVPANWRIGLRFVHEVWVPSNFTADAVKTLLPGGRGPRVRVVPYPVATAPPIPARLDRKAFGLPDDAVIVLVSASIASSMARKNPLAAIAAFRAAFGDRRDRLLVLKLGKAGHYLDDFAAIRAAVAGFSNVRIETRTFPSADNHAFTACCDIVLSLHRSEGFGLVPAEAMLLGKPVVATAWSGNMQFMDADSTALVGYTLIPVSDPRRNYEVPGAVWAEPSVSEAADQLRRLADSASLRAALGARGRTTALARLGVGPLRDAVAGIGVKSMLGPSASRGPAPAI